MNTKKKLSIIIINFNSYHLLENCLQSLSKSTLAKNLYEVFVVDNNSREKEADMIKRTFPWVRVFEKRENEGFAKANNTAIKDVSGECVLLLNPDTVVSPETLAKVLKTMQSHPDAGIVTCKVVLRDGTLDDACHRGFPTPWNALCHFIGVGKLFAHSLTLNGYHLGYKNMDHLHTIDSCCGAFMLVRKSAGDQVGWLDEDYFWYGEDIDFCFRVKRSGWNILFDPSCTVVHLKGASSGIKNHSISFSKADRQTQLLATKMRFNVMKIFYEKHYKKTYPSIIKNIVFFTVDMKKIFTLWRLGFRFHL